MKDKHRKEKDMPDENETETTRPDADSAEESIFGDKAAAVVEEQEVNEEAERDTQGSDDVGEPADAEAQTDAPEELKVVVSIRGGSATIGVQRPSTDPHIESFDDRDISGLAQEVTAVTERARARWEETPKHPAYERPAPPAKRRNRRQQGEARDTNAGPEAAEAQQQTLRLF